MRKRSLYSFLFFIKPKTIRNTKILNKLIFCILCLVLFASFCYASTPREEYKKLQKDIKTHKEKLKETKRRESSILTDIENTNKQLKEAELELKKYKNSLMNIESSIAKVEKEIYQKRISIEKQREWIKRKLRAMHRYGQNSETIMLFLGADDASQLIRTSKYLQYITVHEHNLMNTYKGELEALNEKEKKFISLKKELEKNKDKVKAKEDSLAEKKKNKEILLASVKKEKSSYAKMLRELENASKRILDIIKESESAEIFSDKRFSTLKGKLPWPVEGRILIPYGSQRDPEFKTPIFRSGTYIQSNSDSVAKAVYNGKVVFAEWFKGYGQLVIVNHGDGYHTLYGSLSEIFMKVGDIIKGNQVVGRIGNSGIVNSPGLYFEVRYKGKPLDPLQWLRRR